MIGLHATLHVDIRAQSVNPPLFPPSEKSLWKRASKFIGKTIRFLELSPVFLRAALVNAEKTWQSLRRYKDTNHVDLNSGDARKKGRPAREKTAATPEAILVRWFEDLSAKDTGSVGGKNASLGQMIGRLAETGIQVPGGFATTADAYWKFVDENALRATLTKELDRFDKDESQLPDVGRKIRDAIRKGTFSADLKNAIRNSYRELGDRFGMKDVSVAVRSSATAEDLPEASFAGQQETFLNISGADAVLEACRNCFASLFTDRAIAYRKKHGFDHMKIALSAGVQKMVHADTGGAGVMFSLDTDSGFPDVVVINAAWGLGENVVQGTVDPDEYRVFKPILDNSRVRPIIGKMLGAKQKTMIYGTSTPTINIDTPDDERAKYVLTDDEILTLARWAVIIEEHYKKPMDMEWARDGETGTIFIVQARPETVQSRKEGTSLKNYRLIEEGEAIVHGLAIGDAIAAGKACVLHNIAESSQFSKGDVLVTEITDPDWVPIMKRAAAIVTDHGGRTSHAAIVSRELGVPAVIGTGDGTKKIRNETEITVSCAEGEDGTVYKGILRFEEQEIDLSGLPSPPVKIMINIANPAASMRWWRLPVDGIGLARMEFIISSVIKIHPLALTRFSAITDGDARKKIEELTRAYAKKEDYFVEHLAWGIASIAAPQFPNPVIVRMSDFKTNEYANLIGGKIFEPQEANPMLGFRGASRYYSDRYKDGFALECRALKRAREEIGMENIIVMLPFVRSLEEADRCLETMAGEGLTRGRNGLKIYMMCEIPSNIFLAEEFAERFDGFSIGSNDLTQLILGVDRDSDILAGLFDERNEAVKRAIREVITKAHKHNCTVGICGQAPSDHPDYAEFLIDAGIDSISLNPDSVIPVIRRLGERDTSD